MSDKDPDAGNPDKMDPHELNPNVVGIGERRLRCQLPYL